MKKILTLVACLSLVATLAVGGSIAYLQDQEEHVNVMTLGNVDVEQFVMERVFDAEGNVTGMKEVTSARPMYPIYTTKGTEVWQPNQDVDDRRTG